MSGIHHNDSFQEDGFLCLQYWIHWKSCVPCKVYGHCECWIMTRNWLKNIFFLQMNMHLHTEKYKYNIFNTHNSTLLTTVGACIWCLRNMKCACISFHCFLCSSLLALRALAGIWDIFKAESHIKTFKLSKNSLIIHISIVNKGWQTRVISSIVSLKPSQCYEGRGWGTFIQDCHLVFIVDMDSRI